MSHVAELIEGKHVAAQICADLKNLTQDLRENHGVVPELVIIEVGDHNYGALLETFGELDGPRQINQYNPITSNYAELKATTAERCGFRVRLMRFSQNVEQSRLLELIGQLSSDPQVHGILVELPLPAHLDEDIVLRAITPQKDVDGFNFENLGRLCIRGVEPISAPSVASAIMELLLRSRVDLRGQEAVVLGRSNTVGTPIATLLQQADCTVTVCHTHTKNIEQHVKRADILVTCVGKPGFVRGSWLKPGAVVIDVGMNSVVDFNNPKMFSIVGDVNFEEARGVASKITPVPGGVGHLSFAILLRNVLSLARQSIGLMKIGMNPVLAAESSGACTKPTAQRVGPDRLYYKDLALRVPEVLLPRAGIDLTKWCVVACDQYTSQPEYWKDVKEIVGSSPSTLDLIFPEVYLGDNNQQIIQGIRDRMYSYIKSGTLDRARPGFVLIDRKTPHVASRKGLLVSLDLESYSFAKGSQSLIRATEKTIEDRLPPRIAIREQASVELPHILVLIDDPDKTVIEPLFEKKKLLQELYNFELMKGSGHLTGYHITSREDVQGVVDALRALSTKERFKKRYDAKDDQGVLLYPVGDGNHSLATAKVCWENLKKQGADPETHPARFALVELENVHDDGLEFEPIHRLVFGANPDQMIPDMRRVLTEEMGCTISDEPRSMEELSDEFKTLCAKSNTHLIEVRTRSKSGSVEKLTMKVANSGLVLEAATLTQWLDGYLKRHPAVSVDYVHGHEVIDQKVKEDANTVGFLLPSMDKNDLVKTVVKEGALPRKTFSMGGADEKRFYFEGRQIVPESVFYKADFFRRGKVTKGLTSSKKEPGLPRSRTNSTQNLAAGYPDKRGSSFS